MNGRMYDPINGRMMRPDNYVQAADNTQSYNRYSYCLNNPMKYVDPSGNEAEAIIAVAIAAAISIATYTYRVYQNDGNLKNWNWMAATYYGIQGGVYGGMGYGVGSAFGAVGTQLGGSIVLNEVARAAAHGTLSYVLSQGSNSAFLAGFFGSAAGSFGGSELGEDLGLNTTVGGTAFAAVTGGAASSIGGGDFWEGAAIGATVHLVNQNMHMLDSRNQRELLKDKILSDGVLTRDEVIEWYMHGDGGALTVPASGLDFSSISLSDLKFVNGAAGINMFFACNMCETGKVYGSITIIQHTDGTYGIAPDKQDYEMHTWTSVREVVRNVATFLGEPWSGKSFLIKFEGNANIK